MAVRVDTSVDFTTDDLIELATVLGVGLASGLGDEVRLDVPDEARRYLAARSRESLIARGAMTAGPPPVVNESVSTLVACLGEPGILVSVSREADGVVETRHLCVRPDIAVERREAGDDIHRLIPFAPQELMRRLLRIVDLRPTSASEAEAFRVSADVVDVAGGLVADGGEDDAVDVLVAAGAPERSARSFVSALSQRHASLSVSILHRPTPATVEGGSLLWIDGGIQGLWVSEVTGGDTGDEMTELVPVSADWIAGELLAFLPEGFAALEETPS